jgi:hypothetical protein
VCPRSLFLRSTLSFPTVSNPPIPTSSTLDLHTSARRREINTALDDALFAISDPVTVPTIGKGVVPWINSPPSGDSMSLGTSRLCSELPSIRPSHQGPLDLSSYDGSTPIACLEWNRLTIYRESVKDKRSGQLSITNASNLTRGSFNGYMSPATRRSVKRSVSTWLRSIHMFRAHQGGRPGSGRAYPVFLTLTLPGDQVHTDAEINRACLQPFLIRLRRDYAVDHYFWRAEAQENGKLHYHLIIDRYIPRRYLQLAWNLSIDALGYLGRYFAISGSLTPPSTEVHRITDKIRDKKTGAWKTVDPVDYLVDYALEIAEPEETEDPAPGEEPKIKRLRGKHRNSDGTVTIYYTRPISGRVWGMSDSVRDLREPRLELTGDLLRTIEKAREQGVIRRVDNDHATMYFGPVAVVLGRSRPAIWKLLQAYYLTIFHHLYPDQLGPEITRGKVLQHPADLWIDTVDHCLFNRPARIKAAFDLFYNERNSQVAA